MPNKRLSQRDLAEIIKMRGLGYTQADIAGHLDISQSAVQYHLRQFRSRAQSDGVDETFVALLIAAGLGIGVGLLLASLFDK